jgi:hypothetical protein
MGIACTSAVALVTVTVLAAGSPAAGAATVAPAGRCTGHSLHLSGPHRAKIGDGVMLRVTKHGRSVHGASIRGFGVAGSLPVDKDGRVTVQFTAAKIYRVVAFRGSTCSNVLAVRVHR